MTDRVIHTNDGSWANTILIVVVILIIAILGFLYATGRLGGISSQPDTSTKTVDVQMDLPEGTEWSTSTTTTTQQ